MYSIKFPLNEETKRKLEEMTKGDPSKRESLIIKLQDPENPLCKERLTEYLNSKGFKHHFILQNRWCNIDTVQINEIYNFEQYAQEIIIDRNYLRPAIIG